MLPHTAAHAPLPPRTIARLAAVVLGAVLVATAVVLEPLPWGVLLLALAGLAGLGWLVWRHPILAAALLPVVLSPPEFLKVFAYEVGLVTVFAVLVVAGTRARLAWFWRLDPIEQASFAFVAWGALTLFWSSSAWWWLFAMRKYGMGALALFTAWRLARLAHTPWPWLRGITLGVLALSAAVFVKAVGSGMLTLGTAFKRIEGTDLGWGKANYLGALLLLMLPSALHLALHAPDRRSRLLGWLSLPCAGLVMATAASRGGAVLLLVVSLAYLVRRELGAKLLPMLAGVAVAVGLLLLGPGSAQFLERFTSPRELGSVVVRLFLLRAGWRRIVEHFPFGMGLGQGIVEPDHLAAGGPHNFLVTITYEAGLPGAVLWCALLVLLFRRAWRERRVPGHEALARTLLFTVATAVLNSMFEGTFEGLHFQFLFFWIVGLLLGALSRDGGTDALSRAGRPAHA